MSTNIKSRSITTSIAIMLRSYTRDINKQENLSGSLFRQHTKAECIDCSQKLTPSFIGNEIIITEPQKQYPQVCFNYIHQNPVKARLVKKAKNWEFSSAIDYSGLRNGDLVNKKIANKYIDYIA